MYAFSNCILYRPIFYIFLGAIKTCQTFVEKRPSMDLNQFLNDMTKSLNKAKKGYKKYKKALENNTSAIAVNDLHVCAKLFAQCLGYKGDLDFEFQLDLNV